MKTKLVTLIIITIFCIGFLICLIITNQFEQSKKNAFVRVLPPFQIEALNVAKLDFKDSYIAGISNNKIYIGSKRIKNVLSELQLLNLKGHNISIKAPPLYKPSEDTRLLVDSFNLYLLDGKHGKIGQGSIKSRSINHFERHPYFSDCQIIDSSAFIFKSVNVLMENVIIKENKNKKIVTGKFLTKQIDGFFSTDGQLYALPHGQRVVYCYYYRNEFIVADSNLNLKYVGQTIDTISQAKIKIAKIESSGQTTLASPALFVNRHVTMNAKYLFVHSLLKADNETIQVHNSSSAIDVYQISNGKYVNSFYLPDFNGRKLSDFRAFGDLLIVLFGDYIYTFKLRITSSKAHNL